MRSNAINYQPQLVNAGFLNHQQYGSFREGANVPVRDRSFGVWSARLRGAAWRPRPKHAQGLCARTYVSGKWGEGKEGGRVI